MNTSNAVSRTCSIPAGTAILIPALNGECSTPEGEGATEAALRACANGQIAGASGTALVDSKPVKVVRVGSPLFVYSLPPDNILVLDPGVSRSVAAGLWSLIPPLFVGVHHLHLTGSIGTFTQDVTYEITVVAPLTANPARVQSGAIPSGAIVPALRPHPAS